MGGGAAEPLMEQYSTHYDLESVERVGGGAAGPLMQQYSTHSTPHLYSKHLVTEGDQEQEEYLASTFIVLANNKIVCFFQNLSKTCTRPLSVP